MLCCFLPSIFVSSFFSPCQPENLYCLLTSTPSPLISSASHTEAPLLLLVVATAALTREVSVACPAIIVVAALGQ